jgi:glycerol-3-phosphate cytidylyltransferase
VERIKRVNKLYDEGNIIKIYTARGMPDASGDITLVYSNSYEKVKKQIDSFGLKYHQLILGKPRYDVFVDDKAIGDRLFFEEKTEPDITGFIAGAFDCIHPGYIWLFEEAKRLCDYLVVGLHVDPSLENGKMKPVLTIDERRDMLRSIRYIDRVHTYETEEDMKSLIRTAKPHIDVVFLGDDYKEKPRNIDSTGVYVHYINRDHGWSATKYKELIYDQIKKKKEG